MPIVLMFVGSLLGGLASAMGSLVGRVLLALGIGYVTYKGFNTGVDWIYQQIRDSMSGLGSDVVSLLGYLWVDRAIGTLFSAYAAATAVKLAGGSSLTKMVIKK